jgi:hypothetical protein
MHFEHMYPARTLTLEEAAPKSLVLNRSMRAWMLPRFTTASLFASPWVSMDRSSRRVRSTTLPMYLPSQRRHKHRHTGTHTHNHAQTQGVGFKGKGTKKTWAQEQRQGTSCLGHRLVSEGASRTPPPPHTHKCGPPPYKGQQTSTTLTCWTCP